MSCQWAAEEDYTTASSNKTVGSSDRLFVGEVNQKTKEHGSMPAGLEAKESPGFFDLVAFFAKS